MFVCVFLVDVICMSSNYTLLCVTIYPTGHDVPGHASLTHSVRRSTDFPHIVVQNYIFDDLFIAKHMTVAENKYGVKNKLTS